MARSHKYAKRAPDNTSATCEICGNEVSPGTLKCPFCESVQTLSSPIPRSSARQQKITTINIKEGLPLADDAITRLQKGIASARSSGSRVVRVIHGWGSSGKGGVIRSRVHQHLVSMRSNGFISDFVPGDEFSISTEGGDLLLQKCPELRKEMVHDRRTPGIKIGRAHV